MPDETREAWSNGWFHTGDAFTYDEDGNYYFVDRAKDYIRRRGENISSFEVESIVNEYPAIAECGAAAVPAEQGEHQRAESVSGSSVGAGPDSVGPGGGGGGWPPRKR